MLWTAELETIFFERSFSLWDFHERFSLIILLNTKNYGFILQKICL